MSLEHPYRGIYLDQQLRNGSSNLARRRKPQATRMVRRTSWAERLIGAAILLAAACSLLFAVLLAAGLVWLIAQVVQEIGRGLRGW